MPHDPDPTLPSSTLPPSALQAPTLPAWLMPADLVTIVTEDGEWEDPSWDPVLLSVIGNTRSEGRTIPIAWQVSLWPGDMFFKDLNGSVFAKGDAPDGHGWSTRLQAHLATTRPTLAQALHDDSDASTCVIWVETEADGRALIEATWSYVHALKAAQDGTV